MYTHSSGIPCWSTDQCWEIDDVYPLEIQLVIQIEIVCRCQKKTECDAIKIYKSLLSVPTFHPN